MQNEETATLSKKAIKNLFETIKENQDYLYKCAREGKLIHTDGYSWLTPEKFAELNKVFNPNNNNDKQS